MPGDTDDVPVTMAVQVQKAVDCYNAGAIVLHTQAHAADSKGSKGMLMLNECWIAHALPRRRRCRKWDLELPHLVRHSQYSHFNLEIHHELP